MRGKRSDAFRVAQEEVCDYFQRMGGSGRYPGFESWHCFALIAIILKRISYQELDRVGVYINHRLWSGCDGLYQRVDQLLLGKERQVTDFLRETDDYMEFRVRRYSTYEEYRGWVTFSWYLRHRDLGCIWGR